MTCLSILIKTHTVTSSALRFVAQSLEVVIYRGMVCICVQRDQCTHMFVDVCVCTVSFVRKKGF